VGVAAAVLESTQLRPKRPWRDGERPRGYARLPPYHATQARA
jgi:hypothetical protein